MKAKLTPFVVIGLLLLTACQAKWNYYTRIYVDNATADSFLVMVTYPPSDTVGPFKIEANQVKFLSSYYVSDESGLNKNKNTDIWLYHYKDTTWTLLSNYHADPEFTNRFSQYMNVDDIKVRALTPNLDDRTLTLTINNQLLQEMVQDTLASDSIFGVR